MKKQVLFLLIISLFLSFDLLAGNDSQNNSFTTSKTFFSVQPIFRPTSPESVSIKRDQLRIYNDKNITFDLTIYGGESTVENKLAKYFLPFGKSKVLVGELGSKAVKDEQVDIIANYFGVLTSDVFVPGDPVAATLNNYTFQSELSFKPKQVFAGAVFSYKHHLSAYTDKGLWLEIVIPFEWVKNDMQLQEKVITKGGPNGNDPNVPKGSVPNMKAAFKQPSWRFGKIDGPQTRSGIADLYARFGYVFVKEETHYLNSYAGFSAPTGNVPTGEFVFEPIVGNNGHFTIFGGTSGSFRIWSKCEKELFFEFDTLGTLYATNEQTRSFDLKDKSWGRYMWVYLDEKATTTSPGINVFSRRLKVDPGSTRDLNLAYVYKECGIQAEAGYHFFARQTEEIKLAQPWQKGPAIASIIQNNEFITGGISRDNATIKEYLRIKNDSIGIEGTDEIYKPIEESDLDLESAAHPAIVSHTVYLALSYNWDCSERPKFVGVGGSYEFSSNNAVLSRWMVWARAGISF